MSAPLRIAVDARALVPRERTGIGVYTQALVRELARRPDLELVCLAHRAPAGQERLEAIGVRFEVQPARLGVLWQQRLLPERLARGDLDVLWSPIHTLPRRSRVPAVVSVHDLSAVLHPGAHTLKHLLSVRPFLRRSLRDAAAIVAISRATARDLERYEPRVAGKVTIIPNGVDEAFRPLEERALAELRARLGFPDGYVLYAGTLEPRKNVGRLLDAWELVRRDLPDAPPLLLAGANGWKERALRARLARADPRALRVLGWQERGRLVELVQAARAFVYPSLFEGFGLPPIEALAAGVPVASAPVPALEDVDAAAWLRFDPRDPRSIAAALRALLTDRERALHLAHAGPSAAAPFRWDRAAERLEPVLQRAVGQRSGG